MNDTTWMPMHEVFLVHAYGEMYHDELIMRMCWGIEPTPKQRKEKIEKINLEFRKLFPNIAL